MKAIVEWGIPKHATDLKICGISGQFIATNPKQACTLAAQLFHTMTQGQKRNRTILALWGVSPQTPRKVVWSADISCWVSVSLLDDTSRGSYAAIADRDAQAQLQAQA